MIKQFLLYSLLLCSLIAIAQHNPKIDSLETALPLAVGNERSLILMELSALYAPVSIEKSLAFDLENVTLQKELGSIKNLSGTYNNIGVTYYMTGDYGKSMDYFEQSLALREQLNDTINIVKTLNNLGVISQITGDFQQALEYLNRSLLYKLDLSDTLSIAKTLNNIGVIYKDVSDFYDAKKFLHQALDLYISVDDQSGIAASCNNLGQVFEALNVADSAMYYFLKSLKIKREINDERGVANTLNNVALIYLDKGEDQRGEELLKEAVAIRQSIGDEFGLASSLNNLGKLYLRQGKIQLSEKHYLESNLIALNKNLLGIQLRNYSGLSKLYEKTGNPAKALENYKRYSVARDSIFNEDLNKQIADLKVKYDSEKSKRELELYRRENEIHELKIANSQKEHMQFITGIVLLFFVSVLVFVFLQYRNNKRFSVRLQNYNRELETRVKERTHEFESANAAKDRFFSIIAHDLKSPFNGLLGFAGLLNSEYDDLTDKEKRDFAAMIEESATGIYKLLENLLEWSSSQTGTIQLDRENLDLSKLTVEIIRTHKTLAENKNISTELVNLTVRQAFADEDTVKTIIRNLHSNAIKFTPKGGHISIVIDDVQGMIRVCVVDDGVGIRKEDVKNLFNLQHKYRSLGTEKEPGTGLGLILCKEFVELNGGTLSVKSQPEKGSTFCFSLPASK